MPGVVTKSKLLLSTLLGLAIASCGASKPATEKLDHHVWVDMSGAWDQSPWSPERDSRGVPLPQPENTEIKASFILPPDFIGHGSVLHLEGLSWTADVSVNGHPLNRVTGGIGLTEVKLGETLQPGQNTISIQITGAEQSSPLLVGHDGQAAALATAPRLLLRPQIGLDHVVANLTKDGLRLHAATRNAPNGTQIQFEGWRDGKRFANWGRALVHNGQAILDTGEWDGSTWPGTPSESPFFMLKATLLSTSGEALDSGAWRTALRRFELKDGRTQLNGRDHRLLGLRNHNAGFVRGIEIMAPTGLNLVEFHGTMPTQAELQMADELGVSLAILPRCDGRIKTDLEQVKAASSVLNKQDSALIKQTAHSPSVLIWSTEGSGLNRKGHSVARSLVANMQKDPMDRLIAGWDMPVFAIPVTGPDARLDEQRERAGISKTTPFWVLEFHLNDEQGLPKTQQVAEAVSESFNIGALGGVLPGAEENNPEWATTWAANSEILQIPPLQINGRRGVSRLDIDGMKKGELITVQAPGAPHTGVVAGNTSRHTLNLWHRGEATLNARGRAQTVTMSPGSWRNTEWMGRPTFLDLGSLP